MEFNGFEMVGESGEILAKGLSGSDLLKTPVSGYTRKDGVYVPDHTDSRAVAQAKATHDMTSAERKSRMARIDGDQWKINLRNPKVGGRATMEVANGNMTSYVAYVKETGKFAVFDMDANGKVVDPAYFPSAQALRNQCGLALELPPVEVLQSLAHGGVA